MGKMKHEFEKLEKNGPEDITDMMTDSDLEVYMESLPANKFDVHKIRKKIIRNMETDSAIMDLTKRSFAFMESELKELRSVNQAQENLMNEIMLMLESVTKKLDESS